MGGILLHYCSHSALEKPAWSIDSWSNALYLFYKILKVKMSHRSTDIVTNDPPGEPAWARWTEKGKASCSVQNEVLHTVEQREDTSLRDCASFHYWCLQLFGQTTVFSDGKPSKVKQRSAYDAEELEEKQRKQISVHKKPLCSIVLRHRCLVPLMGRIFKGVIGPWTVLVYSSVSCQCPPWQVITLAICFKPYNTKKYSKVVSNLGHIKLPA